MRLPYSSFIESSNIENVVVKSSYKDGMYKCFNSDYIRWMNNDTTAGENINIRDAITGKIIDSKNFTICCSSLDSSLNPSTEKNLLFIGDSFIQNGTIVNEMYETFQSKGLTNIRFIGGKTTSKNVKHQGMGGYGFRDFV